METRNRYNLTDCFETFVIPHPTARLLDCGGLYHQHRRAVTASTQQGLTALYNRFHDSDESAAEIQKLRQLHVEMDKAVLAAYGWDDLDLGHDFHETKQGVRFTISEAVRREVLGRLLKLNHERYAEEVKQGPHEKGRAKRGQGRGRKKTEQQEGNSLFNKEEKEEHDEEAEAKQDDQPAERPTPIEAHDTDDVMAAFRQSARGRGLMERSELLKLVSVALGFQRLGPKIEEALRGHLRAAIRRKIIEADGELVRPGTTTMEDYALDELREFVASVMRKGPHYDRDDVITAVARTLGFARVTDTSRDALKSAINSAIRQGILGYEGSVIWREQ